MPDTSSQQYEKHKDAKTLLEVRGLTLSAGRNSLVCDLVHDLHFALTRLEDPFSSFPGPRLCRSNAGVSSKSYSSSGWIIASPSSRSILTSFQVECGNVLYLRWRSFLNHSS